MELTHRLHSFLIMLCLSMVVSYAQQDNVSGRVIDQENREAMVRATVQLYRLNGKDTTFVTGVFSNANGNFSINSVRNGSYLLKATYLGYKDIRRNVTKAAGRSLALGTLKMQQNAVELQGATVTATCSHIGITAN